MLARDEAFDLRLRLANAGLVGKARDVVHRDVVPRAHHVTGIDRDRALARVRKHEAQRHLFGQRHFVHDRQEVPAVGAEAVQPQDRRNRIGAGRKLDVREAFHGVRPWENEWRTSGGMP